MTTMAPAASAATSASRVRSEMVPSLRTTVPSRSVATTRGPLTATRSCDRLEHLATEQLLQRLRHPYRAVGLLMHLEQRDDRARHRHQGAVQRRDRCGPVVGAVAHGQPPGLELRAVRRRRDLAVALLRRDPRLAVELARRRQTEVAGRDVDDAERQLQVGEELLLPLEQPPVLV